MLVVWGLPPPTGAKHNFNWSIHIFNFSENVMVGIIRPALLEMGGLFRCYWTTAKYLHSFVCLPPMNPLWMFCTCSQNVTAASLPGSCAEKKDQSCQWWSLTLLLPIPNGENWASSEIGRSWGSPCPAFWVSHESQHSLSYSSTEDDEPFLHLPWSQNQFATGEHICESFGKHLPPKVC